MESKCQEVKYLLGCKGSGPSESLPAPVLTLILTPKVVNSWSEARIKRPTFHVGCRLLRRKNEPELRDIAFVVW